MDFVAYHDRTSADHQAHFNDLFPKGYRMTSLSVYGARGDERYAAVWVKRAGPNWSAVHGVNGAGYQTAFNTAVAAGMKPVLLAASGPANDPVFAGTFEQRTGPVPLTRFGLTRSGVLDDPNPDTIDHWISQARANGWMPAAIAIYGTAPGYRYAAIFVDNPTGINWGMQGLADSGADYQQRFNATVPVGGRPFEVAVSPDDRYASIFRDDSLGDWFARHEMTSADYQQAFDQAVPKGYWPVSVRAGGAGAGARFAAVFAKDDQPLSLAWQGPTGPVANASIDAVMQSAMQRHRIRGAALALVHGGKLIYARGYTLAEPGYPVVQPATKFRQASVSKFVVALAIHRLIQDGRLALSTPVQSILNLSHPDGTAPAASFGQVTIQHLLEHRSGLPTNPYGVEPSVAQAFGTALPVNGRQTDRYMVTLPASPPPQPLQYSNWGYFLLGHVVMAVTGKPSLPAALDGLLLSPLSITGVRSARTLVESQPADEARYHPTRFDTGPSVMEPDRRLRAVGFGGPWNFERDDSGGGLSASVVDIARMLAMLDIRLHNPVLSPASIANLFTLAAAAGRGHGLDAASVDDPAAGLYSGSKGGDLPESSQNCIRYSTADYSMAICFNRHDIAEGGIGDQWWCPDFPALLDVVRKTSWTGADLFPGFGMPTLLPIVKPPPILH